MCYRAAVLALPREARLGRSLAVTIATLSSSRSGAWSLVPADGRRDSPSGLELLGLGAFLAVAVVVPLLVGLGIDTAAHTAPLGLLVGLLVGVAGAVVGLWVRLRRYL